MCCHFLLLLPLLLLVVVIYFFFFLLSLPAQGNGSEDEADFCGQFNSSFLPAIYPLLPMHLHCSTYQHRRGLGWGWWGSRGGGSGGAGGGVWLLISFPPNVTFCILHQPLRVGKIYQHLWDTWANIYKGLGGGTDGGVGFGVLGVWLCQRWRGLQNANVIPSNALGCGGII